MRERGKKKRECNAESDFPALTLTLALFSVPGAGLEPAQPLWPQDFKSCVSTIPPSGRNLNPTLKKHSPACRTLSTPAVWLLAKNTHRVFYLRSPLPSGQKLSCGLAVLQSCSLAVMQLCSCAVVQSSSVGCKCKFIIIYLRILILMV